MEPAKVAEMPDLMTEDGFFDVEIAGLRYRVPRHCPHRGGRLDHGTLSVQRKTVSCPLHRSLFDLDTGRQLTGPACGHLAVSVQPARDVCEGGSS
jgi:type I protein arginine methyltransferase